MMIHLQIVDRETGAECGHSQAHKAESWGRRSDAAARRIRQRGMGGMGGMSVGGLIKLASPEDSVDTQAKALGEAPDGASAPVLAWRAMIGAINPAKSPTARADPSRFNSWPAVLSACWAPDDLSIQKG